MKAIYIFDQMRGAAEFLPSRIQNFVYNSRILFRTLYTTAEFCSEFKE
jgi:hypothetical protein